MDPRIKAGIFAGESGGDLDTLFGYSNRPGGQFSNVRPTQMTVDQVIDFTNPRGPYAQWVKRKIGRVATPVGGYQIVGSTLRNAKKALGLSGTEMFDEATQDRLGDYILKTQGTGAWEGYRGPRNPSTAKLQASATAAFKPSGGSPNARQAPVATSGSQALFAAAPTIGQTQGESSIEPSRGREKTSVSDALAQAYQQQADAQKEAAWAWVREAMQPRQVATPFNIWSNRYG